MKSDDLLIYNQLKKLILSRKDFTYDSINSDINSIAKYLLKNALEEFKNHGFGDIKHIIKLLRQSSCFGNHEASFMLSVIYLHGIGIKSDETIVRKTA